MNNHTFAIMLCCCSCTSQVNLKGPGQWSNTDAKDQIWKEQQHLLLESSRQQRAVYNSSKLMASG